MCSYCSCCDYCRVAKAVIRVTSGAAIGTTYSVAVGIASRINKIASKISGAFCGRCCRRY